MYINIYIMYRYVHINININIYTYIHVSILLKDPWCDSSSHWSCCFISVSRHHAWWLSNLSRFARQTWWSRPASRDPSDHAHHSCLIFFWAWLFPKNYHPHTLYYLVISWKCSSANTLWGFVCSSQGYNQGQVLGS